MPGAIDFSEARFACYSRFPDSGPGHAETSKQISSRTGTKLKYSNAATCFACRRFGNVCIEARRGAIRQTDRTPNLSQKKRPPERPLSEDPGSGPQPVCRLRRPKTDVELS
jgi:hypothetical protein